MFREKIETPGIAPADFRTATFKDHFQHFPKVTLTNGTLATLGTFPTNQSLASPHVRTLQHITEHYHAY